jgi:5-methyltetrahydropteroyltriglutamate--homocysteine methyltransferase
MTIETEPIGSVPRPPDLIHGLRDLAQGKLSQDKLAAIQEKAIADTIRELEATGSPVISDGEQTKPSFATYPIHGLRGLDPNGVVIPFADGHQRQLPLLTSGPFRYATYADTYLKAARKIARVPVKQAVISASALGLLYPQKEIEGYARAAFVEDLVNEAETDIRRCLQAGAHAVQIDFTEARLSLKLDPSGALLKQFISLNNRVLDRFTPEERRKIGVHTCPGGDQDSTHSADVDYAGLLPDLFQLAAGKFYIQLASEKARRRVLAVIKANSKKDQMIFVGVTDPISPRVENPREVHDRILEAEKFIPAERLGTTDDCGFAPFADDTSTARETAFGKIRARVEGTRLAERTLGLSARR